jgi:hypothetical protein
MALARGHDEQRDALVLHHPGDALQEQDGGRVGEGIAEVVGEQQAERVPAARAQAPGRRVRARVAEVAGPGEDPLAQLGRKLVGPVVGVGDRRARHAEGVGDRLQRHAAGAHARQPTAAGDAPRGAADGPARPAWPSGRGRRRRGSR